MGWMDRGLLVGQGVAFERGEYPREAGGVEKSFGLLYAKNALPVCRVQTSPAPCSSVGAVSF